MNSIYERADYPCFEIKAKLNVDKRDAVLVEVCLKEGYAELKMISEEEYNELAVHEDMLPNSSNYVTALVSAGILGEWEDKYREVAREFRKSIYEMPRPLLYLI